MKPRDFAIHQVSRQFAKVSAVFTIIILLVAGAVISLLPPRSETARATLAGFSAGNIMSDYVMGNKNTMSVAQIQAFLSSKNSCNKSVASESAVVIDSPTRAHYKNSSYVYSTLNGKFVCLANEKFDASGMPSADGGETAAQIIYAVAQQYSINPQVLIVLLEKEQGLITDQWPNSRQYQTATGYGCPDTAACDSKYYGLKNQLASAANLFRTVLGGGWSNYPAFQTVYVQYSPDASCGGSNVYIANYATSALYRYTPYQPNAAALAAGTGSAACGAYGNRNFYNYFTEWFGSTQITMPDAVDARYQQLGGASGWLGTTLLNSWCNDNMTNCWQQYQNGFIIYSSTGGAWESSGGIRERWAMMRFDSGVMGFPTGPVASETLNGQTAWWQCYQGGCILGSAATGFWESKGGIREEYKKFNFEHGWLGLPTGPENWTGKGWWQSYQGGIIIGSTATGFYPSNGGIRDRWSRLGFENGVMGFPTSETISETLNGQTAWWQCYQGGCIIGSAATGFWESKGGIREEYKKTGFEYGSLGLPTGSETYDGSNSWHQNYQNGVIYYSGAKGGSYELH